MFSDLQARSQSRSAPSIQTRCQLSPAVENPNSAPAVPANVHRLSRSCLNHDSIFFHRFVFLYRIRDVGVRVCCRRLRSPIVSTGRRFPLIASCRFCVHYLVRFLHIDLGSLPFFVLLQMLLFNCRSSKSLIHLPAAEDCLFFRVAILFVPPS